jgi:hypothetical protein
LGLPRLVPEERVARDKGADVEVDVEGLEHGKMGGNASVNLGLGRLN